MKFKIYGFIHKTAKKVFNRNNALPSKLKMVSFPTARVINGNFSVINAKTLNENEYIDGVQCFKQAEVYPIENIVNTNFDYSYPFSFCKKTNSIKLASSIEEASTLWPQFIINSQIAEFYRNGGIHYTGFIKECQQWCLPSWIWTNAAIVRYYCLNNQIDKAKELGKLLIEQQQDSGGWIVRSDYSKNGVIPILAPNDSCYIALNCCLSLYEATNDAKYLESAEATAKWVKQTARFDGMVWFGYDTKKNEWIKERNIVDVGFTASLFARLYEITREEIYLVFLKKFTKSYINIFYMPLKKCFSTAIDVGDYQYGGAFGRGQGWALEGLIPTYRVLKDSNLKRIINDTVETILSMQLYNGGWSYNLLKPLMGEDCKAVPVIAKCLLDWYELDCHDIRLLIAAKKALRWCAYHTAINSEGVGGIFSYTIEGAIAHNMYTETAFVYGSSYALEVQIHLQKIESNDEVE